MVATYTNARCPCTATIDWGDSASSNVDSATNGKTEEVSGTHTYAEEGTYKVDVGLKEQSGAVTSVTGTANVTDAPLTAAGVAPLSVAVGDPPSGPVATFTDADPAGTASDYTVTIDWGDGSAAAAGAAAPRSGGGFDATGSHAYSTPGARTVTVTVTDAGGASSSATSMVTAEAGAGPPPATTAAILTGLAAGGSPNVRLFGVQGNLLRSFFAFDPAFTGGVFVAAGDLNGDKVADLVTGSGGGAPADVRVFNGLTGALHKEFAPFDPSFTGGVRVAVGDVNGDGVPDIAAGAGPGGGPHVKVFNGVQGNLLHDFFAYAPSFSGGVNVAVGDVNGDGRADVITGAGAGGGPHVKVFSGADGKLISSFIAFDAGFSGGVNVAAGDVNGDGRADIVTGAGAGGGPHVKVFNGIQGNLLHDFFAFDPAFQGGVNVAAGDLNGDGRADVIAGAGPGGGPHVKAFSGVDGSAFASFDAYAPSVSEGVLVAAGPGFLPAVQRFTLTRTVFRVANFQTPVRARAMAAAVPRGTAFRFVLNGPGKVKITIAARKGKRFVKRGVLTRAGQRGVNRVRFSGRIGHKTLPPGRYRATITTSTKLPPRQVLFRIVAG